MRDFPRFVFVFFIVLLLGFSPCAWSEDYDDYNHKDNPEVVPLFTQLVYNRISNLTGIFSQEIIKRLNFCIKDTEADWNGAFNFSSNLGFLANCIRKTKGDLTQRLCTAAEIKFYFNGFINQVGNTANYLRPNNNCNLTSWLPGCEPGWACSVGRDQKVNLKESEDMPDRTADCQPCCEGFFCPHGITCMIPCPLGAYCPLATLNETTGMCDPYHYQLPPENLNHTCGGADAWADVTSSGEVFCSAGSYCPTTTQKIPCSSGHYCRLGSTTQQRCFKLTSCDHNSATQNIHAYGVMLFAGLSTLLLIIYNCSDQVLTTRERRLAKSREAAARSARETAQARERWKSARDIAKKGAMGLQTQLSRTFSRKKTTRAPEPPKVSVRPGTDDALLPPMIPGSSSAPPRQTSPPLHSVGQIQEPSFSVFLFNPALSLSSIGILLPQG